MENHLIGVLARLLHTKNKHNSLLSPIRSLKEVVELEMASQCLVWKVLVHAAGVEEPHRGRLHDVEAERSNENEVHDGIGLLHEARLFPTTGQSPMTCQRPQNLMHDELPREREEDDVKEDKGKVIPSLGILDGLAGSFRLYSIARKDEPVHRVAVHRVEAVDEEKRGDDGKRKRPGVSNNEALYTVVQGGMPFPTPS